MKLKASVAVATLAIILSAGAGARAESCPNARQAAQGALPVVVEEYYPHTDRTPAPVNAAYSQPASPSDDYGFPDFNYDPLDYDSPYTAAYGLGGYGFAPFGFQGDGRRHWDNDRGGGHSRVRPGPIGMGRR